MSDPNGLIWPPGTIPPVPDPNIVIYDSPIQDWCEQQQAKGLGCNRGDDLLIPEPSVLWLVIVGVVLIITLATSFTRRT